jgi:hypothetical protein
MVDVRAGADVTLTLDAGNAEAAAITGLPAAGEAKAGGETTALLARWQDSVFRLWSPTAPATGFVVDDRGLIATDRHAVGSARTIEFQLSPTVKVPARVLVSEATSDVAIVWVDPAVIAGRTSLPLPCPPAPAPALDDGQEIVTLTMGLRSPADLEWGEVTGLRPRGIEADLRLDAGGSGGPVFDEAGAVVGLTSVVPDPEGRRRRDVTVVRVGVLCEALSAARAKAEGAPPAATRLPVEPGRAFPASALTAAPKNRAAAPPPVAAAADFEVALLTPPMLHEAQQKADWTGGQSGRAPEAEARLGRLTEFGVWADYFADLPAVLIVRVTPKMVEGFWKRLGREAARTQGAVLPAFKDFKADFLRMRAACGAAEVTPIHPFVLEHRLSETDVVREGLYVFDPGALGPACGTVTLSIYAEKTPERADTVTIDPKALERVWQDFERYRSEK